MQIDMHYYGTYAMARAAGIKPEVAQTIATASQFVDDFESVQAELSDGVYLMGEATAYDPMHLENVMPLAQRRVWLPFHFLPGNEGQTYEERLICRMDSPLSRQVIDHALAHASRSYGPVMMGVAAHVYADTFAHYGFSGVSSDVNEVMTESIKPKVRQADLLEYVTGYESGQSGTGRENATNALKLGHGGAATLPDKPYLKWTFRYADGRSSGQRDNLATYMLACQRLHEVFVRFGEVAPQYADSSTARSFADIEMTVGSILAEEGVAEERIERWQRAARDGQLYATPAPIPKYPQWGWTALADGLAAYTSASVQGDPLYQFLHATELHRNYVLGEMLPSKGLNVLMP